VRNLSKVNGSGVKNKDERVITLTLRNIVQVVAP
jgi:hypothetical protein